MLLLLGGRTTSPDLRGSIDMLSKTLPDAKLAVLEGQEHNAMDGDRERLAAEIWAFLHR